MPFDEDLSVFLDAAEFATAATYNGSISVSVIHDAEYLESMGIAGTSEAALGRAADFAAPVGKTLLIGAVTYTIRNKRPLEDGALVVLELEKP